MEKHSFAPLLRREMESAPLPFAVYQFIDRRVFTLVLSAGFLELFGFSDRGEAYEVMDRDMYRDTHPDDVSRIADAAFRFAADELPYNVLYRSRRPGDREYRLVHAFGKHIYTEDGVRLAVVWYADEGVCDERAPKSPNELGAVYSACMGSLSQLRENRYDFLTGLPSMSYYFELAEAGRQRIRAEGGEAAFLFFDLIGMKLFNARHGFAEGDRLLHAFARVLIGHFSVENCGRFGQDHFAVYTAAEGLGEVLEHVMADCRSMNEGKSLPVRVGVYLDELESVDVGTACDRAKMACDSKRGAFLSVCRYFDMSLLADSARRQYILEHFSRALSERWIKVYYQPIVRASTGAVCNEEALARWFDPEKGMLAPAEFVPILEDAQLIYRLDLYMVDQVLAEFGRRAELGLPAVPVSVNLSRTDFACCDLVEEICRRVDAASVSREQLIIEITESTIGQDPEHIREEIARFRSLGFRVWLDDFGSGYSSLDVLQTFDVDTIKFDLSFMQQFRRTEKSRIIMTELMKMALMLGIDTVVEGVQTADQVRFLNSVGSDKLQGDYYSKPIPLEEIAARRRAGSGRLLPEDTRESAYYTAIGTSNLCDPGAIETCVDPLFRPYLHSLPMAVIERGDGVLRFLRFNEDYAELVQRCFGMTVDVGFSLPLPGEGEPFSAVCAALDQCAESGDWISVHEEFPGGWSLRSLLRRVAVNPVTGALAFSVIPIRTSE